MKKVLLACFLLSLFIYACSTKPFGPSNKEYRKQAKAFAKSLREVPAPSSVGKAAAFEVGTVNFNLRKPNFVIIHHTAQKACEETLKSFTSAKSQVSAHYVICKDGTIHHMLNDYLRAWHGGVAKWGNLTDINSASIGIELDNNGFEPFSDEQINNLLQLLAKLKKDYNIPAANFIGHSDIAPSRKVDPNANFPWKRLAENGFGNWPDAVLDTVPSNFNSIHALRMIGYDTKDSTAAIKAFKLHFIQTDVSPALTDSNKMVLQNLVSKY